MSELDVIVIHIRAEQAAEYERLFAENELPRWRDYKARGAFLSARISRVAFGTDNRQDVIKYVIAVEVPGHAAHSEHDADPGCQEFNRRADLRAKGARFRTSITAGVAIRQVLLHDPAGNLVELFEPAPGYHERTRQQPS